jgi:hypothetical protein
MGNNSKKKKVTRTNDDTYLVPLFFSQLRALAYFNLLKTWITLQ